MKSCAKKKIPRAWPSLAVVSRFFLRSSSQSWLAGGLSAAGLPAGHIPLALGFFTGGVEIAHFSFVAIALLAFVAADQWTKKLPEWSWKLPPYAIGSVAAYWLIARLAS